MKKMFFTVIALVAFTGSSFASKEVINDDLKLKVDENIESNKSLENIADTFEYDGGYKNCSTTTYGKYITHYVNEGVGIMDGQAYSYTTTVYQITGECTTCQAMGHEGVSTTTSCWGYGY